ncbi:hypothetical protein [Streptomyces sp. NPDC006739]|uniref:hypothetical protein n=1 Tax=Streptomyces sp. NPDC006739 TaxID=3364763 RepID=UPI0036C84260
MVVAAGLLAAGCSTGRTVSGAQVTPPPIGAAPTAPVTGYDGLIQLPLSAYGTSEQDDLVLYRTNEALITRCMKSRGHTSYASQNMTGTATKTHQEKEATRPAGAWGYIGAATAKRIGFHVAVPLKTANGPTGRALKDYNACWGQAGKQLPSLADTPGGKLVRDLFSQSFQLAGADSRVGAARKRWSACMNTAGHPADAPEKLAGDRWDTDKPTANEIATATADESCTRSSQLAAVYFTVLAGSQRQLISANITVLTGYQKQVQEQMDQAAHLLSATATT